MTRYYSVEISGGPTFTSHPNGQFDANSLNVEMDITTTGQAIPGDGCYLKIWGVGLQVLKNANQLWKKSITVRGGMQKGLPLANPAQAGVLINGGLISRPFGTWNMTDQALEMIITSGGTPNAQPGPNAKPSNAHIALTWAKGKPLGPALKQALASAFPDFKIVMNLAQNIVAPQDQHGFHANLQQLSYFAARMSQQIVGGSYQGVSIVAKGSTINVFDGPQQGAGQVSFTDLVGQPMWVGPKEIQFKTVMRADLDIGSKITLPKTWINSSPEGAGSAGSDQQGIQGTFQIVGMRHIGCSRAPSGDAWVSIFNCTQN